MNNGAQGPILSPRCRAVIHVVYCWPPSCFAQTGLEKTSECARAALPLVPRFPRQWPRNPGRSICCGPITDAVYSRFDSDGLTWGRIFVFLQVSEGIYRSGCYYKSEVIEAWNVKCSRPVRQRERAGGKLLHGDAAHLRHLAHHSPSAAFCCTASPIGIFRWL
jgi:hypothetical protein